jgi:uncharacterized membrane protein YjgN (DUF898 family)
MLNMSEVAARQPAPMQTVEPFRFTATGSEYFRIWTVNSLLTILTLGIYSAWAKVRSNRYFYGSTRLAGASFDYHGNPITILKGRIIAVALLGAYQLAQRSSPTLAGVLFLLLVVAMPWLLWKSLQFRLFNSSYRGIRFGFRGSAGGAYQAYLLWPLLAVISAYLLAPFAHQRIKRFQHSESRFGHSWFSFDAGVGGFYLAYLKTLAFVLVYLLLLGLFAFGVIAPQWRQAPGNSTTVFTVLLILISSYASSLVIYTVFASLVENLIWNHTRLDDHRFECRMSWKRVAFISITNLAGVILTLGLYHPFAKVRMLKYRVESMALIPAAGLDHFLADAQLDAGATGEGMADLLGFDISL